MKKAIVGFLILMLCSTTAFAGGHRGGRYYRSRGFGPFAGGFIAGTILGAAVAQPAYRTVYVNSNRYILYRGVYYVQDIYGNLYYVPVPTDRHVIVYTE